MKRYGGAGWGGGGGRGEEVTQQMFIRGGSAPIGPTPYPFI